MEKSKEKKEMDLEKMGGDIEQKFFGCIVEEEIKPPYETLTQNEIMKIMPNIYLAKSKTFTILYYSKNNILKR